MIQRSLCLAHSGTSAPLGRVRLAALFRKLGRVDLRQQVSGTHTVTNVHEAAPHVPIGTGMYGDLYHRLHAAG
ncbi:MAG: hypothetical protein WD227_10450 [Vicinamibacterales bacterium]